MRNSQHGFVKCVIASPIKSGLSNPKLAAKDIKDIVHQAYERHGANIVIFPELSLTGYTCQDLFSYSDLLEKSEEALKELLKDYEMQYIHDCVSTSNGSGTLDSIATPGPVIVIGAPLNVNDTLYNCAFVIQDGEILGIVPKQYIPNYGEFYEKRWFTPFTDNSITTVNLFGKDIPFGNLLFSSSLGYTLGVEICEDLWSVIPPSSYMALAGANIIANLSASNELVGKDEYRQELIKMQSTKTISAYLYVSSGFSESTSDLVFGGSGYAYENGRLLSKFDRFITDADYQIRVFDVDIEALTNDRLHNKTFSDSKRNLPANSYKVIKFEQTAKEDYRLENSVNAHPFVPSAEGDARSKVCKEIINIQSTGLARRLATIHNSKVTIGISGGLDSTLALIVCNEAFKKLHLDVSGIMAVTMPGFGTTNRTYNNAIELCNQLGVSISEISIKDACIQHFKDIGHDPAIHDITYENVQARERTQILMDLANKNRALLVGTGDLSELVLGWCTYNGDHMSMYGVNCSIPKTLVKYLIEWYAMNTENPELAKVLMDIIDTPISPELLPTDGNKVVQKTENSVGPYEVIDFFIYNLLRKHYSREKILFLADSAFRGKYSKEELEGFYNSFIKRYFNMQFKRNCLPDGPKVGTVSVSPRGDLRMPSDADGSDW